MQYLSLYDWLISLSIMSSWFIHDVTNGRIFFTHLPIGEYLGCFHNLAVVNSAAVNKVQDLLCNLIITGCSACFTFYCFLFLWQPAGMLLQIALSRGSKLWVGGWEGTGRVGRNSRVQKHQFISSVSRPVLCIIGCFTTSPGFISLDTSDTPSLLPCSSCDNPK